jgi:hypothetical protein
VKTAAAQQGVGLAISAMSGAPFFLMPAASPAASKPVTANCPAASSPARLVNAVFTDASLLILIDDSYCVQFENTDHRNQMTVTLQT